METIGERIKRARLAHQRQLGHRYGRGQLARAIGRSDEAVKSWETGTNEPKAMDAAAVCRVLGVTADWLLGLSEMGGPRPPAPPAEAPNGKRLPPVPPPAE